MNIHREVDDQVIPCYPQDTPNKEIEEKKRNQQRILKRNKQGGRSKTKRKYRILEAK